MAEFDVKCPHCNAELSAEEEWLGHEVECPACKQKFTAAKTIPQGSVFLNSNQIEVKCIFCGTTLFASKKWLGMKAQCPKCMKKFIMMQETLPVPQSSVSELTVSAFTTENKAATETARTTESEALLSVESESKTALESPALSEPTFTFVCPECGTPAALPINLKGKVYECKACCEKSTVEPATERKCPHCGKMIKFHATICKYCKKSLAGSVSTPNSLPSSFDESYDPKKAQKLLVFNQHLPAPISANKFQRFRQQPTPKKQSKEKTAGIVFLGIGIFCTLITIGIIYSIDANEKRIAEENRIAEEIDRKIETAKKANTAEEIINQLKQIMSQYATHASSSKIKKLIEEQEQYIADCNTVREEIKRAEDAKTYKEGYLILQNIIKNYPNNYYIKEAKQMFQEFGEILSSISFSSSGNCSKIYLMYHYSPELAQKFSFINQAFKKYRNMDTTVKAMNAKCKVDTFCGRKNGMTIVDVYNYQSQTHSNFIEANKMLQSLLSQRSWIRQASSSNDSFRFEHVPTGHYLCFIYCSTTNETWWTDSMKKDDNGLSYSLR